MQLVSPQSLEILNDLNKNFVKRKGHSKLKLQMMGARQVANQYATSIATVLRNLK